MATQRIIHDLTPQEDLAAQLAGKARAEQMLAEAQTFLDREVALAWIASFTTNILQCRRLAERQVGQ